MPAKKTVLNEVTLSGVGLHSGKAVDLTLKPSSVGEIVFVRTDLKDTEFRIDPNKIAIQNSSTLVTEKGKIRTLEHLMAVLYVFGINSLVIEMNSEEIPALDGSALGFCNALQQAGIKILPGKAELKKITKPFIIQEKEASVSVLPDPDFKITYVIEYPHPLIKKQGFSLVVDEDSFVKELAPARTFGFLEEVPALRARGLALGGSLENAVVLDEKEIISGPLRFPDEFVRHKILDLVGDLSSLIKPVAGHFVAKKAGHSLHLKIVRYLLNNPDHWTSA